MKQRPLSPHLQIYKLPLAAVLSITHRLTGLALTAGLAVMVLWLLAAVLGDEYYHIFLTIFGGFIGKTILFFWTWALFFHLANGIRHLFWDAGYGFKLTTTAWTNWLVIGSSLILNLFIWIFACVRGCHAV